MAYPPALYAKLHVGNPGDLAFYRSRCKGADSILELGCGYGRVMEALTTEGRTIVGLDRDLGLIDLARKRLAKPHSGHTTWINGDMRRFALARRFDRILLPYSGLYCLPTDMDIVACFACVREHLAPGSLFVFDAYCANGLHHQGVDEDDDEVFWIEHAGTHYCVSESSQWDPATQTVNVVYVHEPRDGGHSIATRLQHHYLLIDQIAPLLAAAGLDLTSLAGDFTGGAIHEDAEFVVATAVAR